MQDFPLSLYLLAEKQSNAAWNTRDLAYKGRCYDRAERLQSVANLLGFKDRHWEDYKCWRDSE